jgi:hypothetical protein
MTCTQAAANKRRVVDGLGGGVYDKRYEKEIGIYGEIAFDRWDETDLR